MPIDEQTAKARAMSESQLFDEVAKILKRCGWRYHHVPATAYRKNHIRRGFPDITAVKGVRLLFMELKREGQALSDEQVEWMNDLLLVQVVSDKCIQYLVFRPSDLLAGRIDEVLAS